MTYGSKVFEKASADKTTAETKGKYYAEISVYNISKVCNTIKIYNKTKLRQYDKDKIAYDKLLILRMKKTMLKLSMKFIL